MEGIAEDIENDAAGEDARAPQRIFGAEEETKYKKCIVIKKCPDDLALYSDSRALDETTRRSTEDLDGAFASRLRLHEWDQGVNIVMMSESAVNMDFANSYHCITFSFYEMSSYVLIDLNNKKVDATRRRRFAWVAGGLGGEGGGEARGRHD